jgi:phage anti-repressor protein
MQLLTLQQNNGKNPVSAQLLYNELGLNKTNWAKWQKTNIVDNPFAIKNEDYCIYVLSKNKRGRPTQDFALSVPFAKKLAMIVRTTQGEKVRDYFLQCEAIAKQTHSIPNHNINQLNNRVLELERKQIDYPNDWTVDRYLYSNKIQSTKGDRMRFGKMCTKFFRENKGTEPKKVLHPSYPSGQNVYPYEVINEVYKNFKNTIKP